MKMSTSVLDYIFRELAISYLGRTDLAHVNEEDLKQTTVGRGSGDMTKETRSEDNTLQGTSAGYVRNKIHFLHEEEMKKTASSAGRSTRTSPAGEGIRRAQAKMQGYEGDACNECGNFTLVRNGTCLKCDTCGATTGCS